MAKYIQYTAYDEEPDCMMCVNVNADNEFCVNECGAKHAWCCYRRLEKIEDEREKHE